MKKNMKRKMKRKKNRKKSRHYTSDAEKGSDQTALNQADVALAAPKKESTGGVLRSPSFVRKVVFYVGFAAFLYLFKTILDTLVSMGLQ